MIRPAEPTRAWMSGEIDDAELKSQVRAIFESLIDHWRAARKTPHTYAQVAKAAERVA